MSLYKRRRLDTPTPRVTTEEVGPEECFFCTSGYNSLLTYGLQEECTENIINNQAYSFLRFIQISLRRYFHKNNVSSTDKPTTQNNILHNQSNIYFSSGSYDTFTEPFQPECDSWIPYTLSSVSSQYATSNTSECSCIDCHGLLDSLTMAHCNHNLLNESLLCCEATNTIDGGCSGSPTDSVCTSRSITAETCLQYFDSRTPTSTKNLTVSFLKRHDQRFAS